MPLQRVGKQGKSAESTIGFFEIDYASLGAEIDEMKEQREASRKIDDSVDLTKSASGNLYRQQSHNMVPFLEEPIEAPKAEEPEPIKAKASSKLSAPSVLSTSKSVLSAQSGVESDFYGPKKQVQSNASNSIWDSEKIQRLAQESTVKEEVSDKKKREEERKTLKQQRIDEIAEALKSVDTRRDSFVSSLDNETGGGQSYQTPQQNLSIFDNFESQGEFSRVASTEGEQLSSRLAEKRKVKDESWKKASPNLTSSDLVSALFDKLTDNE